MYTYVGNVIMIIANERKLHNKEMYDNPLKVY